MTFLNPLVLIGLAAASIPLILHLLSLRKPRIIEFSSLAFLKELQRTSIRRLRLQQILLLIIRTALVAFIVLAFSRPVIRGSLLGSMGAHAHTSAVLVLDDSFSMSAADERGQLFRQAKEAARHIVALLKEGDEVSLLRMSDLPNPPPAAPTHDFEHLSRIVTESGLSSAAGSLEDALRMSAKILSDARNANKEIYIISDVQQTMALQSDQDAVAGEEIVPEGTKTFVFPIGGHEIDNVAVDSAAVRSQIFEKGKPVGITARVRNWGKAPLRDYLVSVYLGRSRVAQQNIDVPPWGSAITNFTVIPKRSGVLSGYLSIEQDAVDEDNSRFLTFTVPEGIRTLFVASAEEDVRFLSPALTAASDKEEEGLFTISQMTPRQFATADLRDFDAVVFSNVPSLGHNDVPRIESFVEQGGGVVFFPGSAIAGVGTRTVLSALDIPPFENPGGDTGSPGAPLSFHHVDVDHALFTGMFDEGDSRADRSIESPEIYRAVQQRTGKRGRTIIGMSNQRPFLTEHSVGEGLVLVFSSAPVLTWTDFPLKGIFAPLIHRCVLYTAAQTGQVPSYTVGEEPIFKLSRAMARRRFDPTVTTTLRSPGGTEEILRPLTRPGDGSVGVPLGKLTEPGFYILHVGGSDSLPIPANVSPAESDLRKMSGESLEKLLASFGVRDPLVAPPSELIEAMILRSRYGVELWKACILAAIACALLEMAVARASVTKERVAVSVQGT